MARVRLDRLRPGRLAGARRPGPARGGALAGTAPGGAFAGTAPGGALAGTAPGGAFAGTVTGTPAGLATAGEVMARSGHELGLAGDITAPRPRPVSTRLQALGVAVDRVRRRPQFDVRQTLLVTGAVAMGLGLVAIVLGWYGASHSAYLFQEVPYLISGGMLGVALVAGGGFLFFAAWIVRLIDEQRRFSSRVEETLEHVDRALAAVVAEAGRASAPGYGPPAGSPETVPASPGPLDPRLDVPGGSRPGDPGTGPTGGFWPAQPGGGQR